MNSEIEELFKNFEVDDKKIPIAFLRYRGKELTYITYQEISNKVGLCQDDNVTDTIPTYDFDVYSIGNYLKIVSKVKKIMKDAGYTWLSDSQDMFEEDTKLYHKTVTFAKERSA